MRAYIVVDLGFGDAGKGLLTDFLVRHFESGLVVRYNGGAQAAHNVVTSNGLHHTFSQFGSGTFIPGVKTYLSRDVVIHPTALLVEGEILKQKGIRDPFSRLRISEQCLVITPFHQATNRIREMIRGEERHGSCGVGVGEAVEDAMSYPEDRVVASDLKNPTDLRKKLITIRKRKREQILEFCKEHGKKNPPANEWQVFENEDVIDAWISSITPVNDLDLVVNDKVLQNWLSESETVIFEGAQGLLLDGDLGFHPYTTWSHCDASNALNLIEEMTTNASVYRIGVMRSYAVRHGPGPLPTETNELDLQVKEHNTYGEWQGRLRYGWYDGVLARYALNILNGVDALAVTHLDILTKLKEWKYCTGYKGFLESNSQSIDMDVFNPASTNALMQHSLSLEQRTQFTQRLLAVRPIFESCDPEKGTVIEKIESIAGRQVDLISSGPTSKDLEILHASPP